MAITLNGSGTITGVTTLGTALTSPTLTTPIVTTTMGVGNATPAASGAGITFPATQSASSDVNTLDDYEEGTWTPAFSGTDVSFTYSTQFGSYVKVGQMVLAQFYLNATASGTTSNNCDLTGLPFASSTTSVSFAQYGAGVWSTATTAVNPLVNSNGSTSVTLWKQGQVAVQTCANMSGTYLVGTFMYRCNA